MTLRPVRPLQLAVCVCTFRRPRGLARLLTALARLEPVPGADLRLVVSDNDPAAGARVQVEAARHQVGLEVVYVHEPRPGIAAARNAAVAAAGEVDAVLFLDDDEWPEPGWACALVAVWRDLDVDVVTGTVLPEFEQSPPDWVLEGRFFERDRFPTGTLLHYARTSNALIGRPVLGVSGLRFPQTASGGGEDTVFFQRALDAGHRIAWADDAVVRESVPPSRVRVRWLLARSYRYGLTRSEVLRMQGQPLPRRLRRAAGGVVEVLTAVLRAPAAAVGGAAARVAVAQQAALGCGLVAGTFGAAYDDYAVVHGG